MLSRGAYIYLKYLDYYGYHYMERGVVLLSTQRRSQAGHDLERPLLFLERNPAQLDRESL
jgi:hypothetical protein